MIEFNILIAIFLLCVLSFFDYIIFNEEILLCLCFLTFLFYGFKTLSEPIFSSFESRASEIEKNLMETFPRERSEWLESFNYFFGINWT